MLDIADLRYVARVASVCAIIHQPLHLRCVGPIQYRVINNEVLSVAPGVVWARVQEAETVNCMKA